MTHRTIALFVLAWTAYSTPTPWLTYANEQPSRIILSDELTAAIQKHYPQPQLVLADDIDWPSCGIATSLIDGDFNGDGRTDYALLLKGAVKGETKWQGKTLKLMELKLVAFLQDGRGAFQGVILQAFDNYHPFNVYLRRQAPGMVSEPRSLGNKTVKIKHPGILMVHCETSSVVFYWDQKANKFQEIWTGD